MSLPVLDLSAFSQGNAQQRQRFGQDFLASLQAHGFVKLVNYGLDRDYIDTLMAWCRRFFQLSPSTKAAIRNQKGPKPQRGYSGIGEENFDTFALDGMGGSYIDVKEHFDQGPCNDISFPNRWPPETASNGLIGFRRFMESYFDVASSLSGQLLAILESALKVNPGTLTRSCSRNDNEMRLNHYPVTTIEEIKNGHVRRTGAHTDYGTLTLLFQDRSGGLQIQDRSLSSQQVSFIPVDATDPYQMVVNVADTLQRWTNDIIPAGLHQVTIPENRHDESEGELSERYSITFFQKSNREESVGSMPDFVNEKRPAKYEHMTAIEYHNQRHAILYA